MIQLTDVPLTEVLIKNVFEVFTDVVTIYGNVYKQVFKCSNLYTILQRNYQNVIVNDKDIKDRFENSI